LIVFFAAIREILKKEIYAVDKARFCALKTKAELGACGIFSPRLPMRRICFVNRSEMGNEPISRMAASIADSAACDTRFYRNSWAVDPCPEMSSG
jgi:hypothetical protein